MEIVWRIIRTAWQGFRRNGWLSFVATFMMMQALLLITLFFSLNVVVNRTIQAVNSRIDVAIFFKEYVPETEILVFQDKINAISQIKSITFISQEQALKNYLTTSQEDASLLEAIGKDTNFLPASLEIKANDTNRIEETVAQIITLDSNQIISDTTLQKNQTLIDRLRKINRIISAANVGLSIIFVIIALLIIFNTIRITIFTRREEIEIMKLVGATDWYIRWPFIIEGVLYGVVGAVWAFIFTWLGYLVISSNFSQQYLSLGISKLSNHSGLLLFSELLVLQLVLGILVGGVSSYLSTKRHLRV